MMEIYERELSVTEQLEQARNCIAQLTAREAELVAEVEKYRAALSSVTDFSNDPAVIRIARNALGEG